MLTNSSHAPFSHNALRALRRGLSPSSRSSSSVVRVETVSSVGGCDRAGRLAVQRPVQRLSVWRHGPSRALARTRLARAWRAREARGLVDRSPMTVYSNRVSAPTGPATARPRHTDRASIPDIVRRRPASRELAGRGERRGRVVVLLGRRPEDAERGVALTCCQPAGSRPPRHGGEEAVEIATLARSRAAASDFERSLRLEHADGRACRPVSAGALERLARHVALLPSVLTCPAAAPSRSPSHRVEARLQPPDLSRVVDRPSVPASHPRPGFHRAANGAIRSVTGAPPASARWPPRPGPLRRRTRSGPRLRGLLLHRQRGADQRHSGDEHPVSRLRGPTPSVPASGGGVATLERADVRSALDDEVTAATSSAARAMLAATSARRPYPPSYAPKSTAGQPPGLACKTSPRGCCRRFRARAPRRRRRGPLRRRGQASTQQSAGRGVR